MSAHKPTRHWLITSFEPFAARKLNTSMIVIEEFKKIELAQLAASAWPFQFHYAVLPVVYATCFQALDAKVRELKNDGIELEGILGLGEGAEEFKLETQGQNLNDVAELADNSGEVRAGKKIKDTLPANAVFPLRFPFEAFGRIRTSTNAGFYVCNHLCAEMSHHYEILNNPKFFGFIHVPKMGSGGLFTPDVCAAVIASGFKKLSEN